MNAPLDSLTLKADRQHPRSYPHMPSDYRHTDKHLRLVKRFSRERGHGRTDRRTDGRTDGQTDGRYPVHYLPRFAVDKYILHI